MEKILAEFKVKYIQILDEEGNADESFLPLLNDKEIEEIYKDMALARVFDEYCIKLQREGRIHTYPPHSGQEAAQIGAVYALKNDDWIFPSFRENAAYIARKMPLELLIAYWAGDERGMNIPNNVNMFTVCIPVSTQIPHAVGFAWGMKKLGKKVVALVFFGDGATSKGDFHESLNFAGTFKLPIIFLCQNNQYAISVPRSRQTASKTLAQKAISYGFEGLQVDGNDVFAVYYAVKIARNKAVSEKIPTFIEAFTYRLKDHTTSDDSSRYRSKQEVEFWKKKDPILRLEKFMQKIGILDEEKKAEVWKECEEKVKEAVKKAENIKEPDPKEMFLFQYDELFDRIKKEMEEL